MAFAQGVLEVRHQLPQAAARNTSQPRHGRQAGLIRDIGRGWPWVVLWRRCGGIWRSLRLGRGGRRVWLCRVVIVGLGCTAAVLSVLCWIVCWLLRGLVSVRFWCCGARRGSARR